MPSGAGVPGGFSGETKKTTPEAIQKQQSDVAAAKTAGAAATKNAAQADTAVREADAALTSAAQDVQTSGGNKLVKHYMNIAWTATVHAALQAKAAKAFAVEAEGFAKEAAATDNDFTRIEAKGAAAGAAAKAKLETEKAEENKKVALSAATAAKAETKKIVDAKAAAAAAKRKT
jgi:hypothetical protein